jgi:hypothetical protein
MEARMTAPDQTEKIATFGDGLGTGILDRLSDQVKIGHQAWIERLKEMQAVEAEFTKEIMATREPSAVLKICNRWIAKRLELLTADSKAFTGFWMDLVMTAASSGRKPVSGSPNVEDS